MNLPTGIQHLKHLKAKFRSRCAACQGTIHPGQDIQVAVAFDGTKTTQHDVRGCHPGMVTA